MAMKVSRSIQAPLKVASPLKRQARSQFGALCFRVSDGQVEFLLITSRRRKRWIIPKGWPENGKTPAEAAATEAYEEAGVSGKIYNSPLGVYTYQKEFGGDGLPCVVITYPLLVKKRHSDYPERSERKRKWFSRKSAAKKVDSPELRRMILTFDPKIHL